jgi:hypothetical protein
MSTGRICETWVGERIYRDLQPLGDILVGCEAPSHSYIIFISYYVDPA